MSVQSVRFLQLSFLSRLAKIILASLFITLTVILQTAYASNNNLFAPLQPIKCLMNNIWEHGQTEVYVPSYAWHNRYTYTHDRIPYYNENPWGVGLGKGMYDQRGDWHALYAFAFLDSHKNLEPVVGYAFLKVLALSDVLRVGGGYGILVTARPDILHNIPFPGILPWIGINYSRLALCAAYIPGGTNVGNVLFVITKITI